MRKKKGMRQLEMHVSGPFGPNDNLYTLEMTLTLGQLMALRRSLAESTGAIQMDIRDCLTYAIQTEQPNLLNQIN